MNEECGRSIEDGAAPRSRGFMSTNHIWGCGTRVLRARDYVYMRPGHGSPSLLQRGSKGRRYLDLTPPPQAFFFPQCSLSLLSRRYKPKRRRVPVLRPKPRLGRAARRTRMILRHLKRTIRITSKEVVLMFYARQNLGA